MNSSAVTTETSGRILWVSLPGTRSESAAQAASIVLCGLTEAMIRLGNTRVDAVLIDEASVDGDLESAVETVRTGQPAVPLIVHLSDPNIALAARLAGWGVQIFGPETSTDDVVDEAIRAAGAHSRTHRLPDANRPWRRALVGNSEQINAISRVIEKIADRKSTVLITGESGTGKEVIAHAIHAAGRRSQKPMLSVNCSAIPESLLESELFGHVKGAFTGAVQQRIGLFERANGGTLFLDEIGDMPVALQAKLLRVLQEQQFQRVGGSEMITVDVRVIAATNASLPKRIADGSFREDLFYRLNVVPLRIAPLRERSEDIPALAEHFVAKICASEHLPVKSISPAAMNRLCRCQWPGNVRQLRNIIEMAIVTGCDERLILPRDLELAQEEQGVPPVADLAIDISRGFDYERAVAEFERKILVEAMQQSRGNKTRAAELLKLGRTTLAAKLRVLGAAA